MAHLGGHAFNLGLAMGNLTKTYTTKRTVRIGNSSSITRKVHIASGSDQLDWTLEPRQYETFNFTGGLRTLFYMKDHASGTHFDVYNGKAPSERDNNFELFDGKIEVNGRSISHDELRRHGNLQ